MARVYPGVAALRRWFEHYASMFDIVEVKMPSTGCPQAAVQGWAAHALPGPVYSLKLGSFGSHRMKLQDTASWLPNRLDRADA